MIISHKHKFIFIKNRKTAGTSIEMMLSQICGEHDVITKLSDKDEEVRYNKTGIKAQNTNIPFKHYDKWDKSKLILKFKRAKYYNHMSAIEVKNHVSENIWNSYFKFCFDRNPYDKVVSLYYWRSSFKDYGSLLNFLKTYGLDVLKSFDIYSYGGLPIVDKIYPFENIDSSIEDISKKLNLEQSLNIKDYRAKSGTRKVKDYKEIIDPESKKIIDVAFAREFKLLNYEY